MWHNRRETEAFLRAFDILKRDGKVRAVGVSTHDLQYIHHFNNNNEIDIVQLDYNILNRKPEKIYYHFTREKFRSCYSWSIKMGILTGKFTNKTIFPDGDLRKDWPNETWFQEDLQTVKKLRLLSNKNQTLGQLALRYVLSHPAVGVVIPGAKTGIQAQEKCKCICSPYVER